MHPIVQMLLILTACLIGKHAGDLVPLIIGR